MDEILIANFMVFHDVVRDDRYNLWIADESWELDYYLHENPGEKVAPFAWFTDFVGWLPMEEGGARESALTADYNGQMVEHIAENPSVRDRALFVGNAEDIVPDRLGPRLPLIRDWTEKHFEFPGYISGFDPRELPPRAELREELGYRNGELVCIVTVGGSGVGGALLRKVISAYPESKRRVPALRMIVVAGPRIDPASLPRHPDLEVVPYVHKLYRHLAACDLAIVQGGLSTAMELTANKRPFLYFPLRQHFEQSLPCAAPPGSLSRGTVHGLLAGDTGDDRRGHRRRDWPHGRLSRRGDRRSAQGSRAPRGDAVIPGATCSAFPELLGECPPLRSVHAQIGRALDVPLPVLIEGETGTGKDLAAWLIHDRGPRRAGPYVTLNCAAMNESLLDLELFGHRRGAFSGADRDRPGLFVAARGGTLFLDEVGELSSNAQSKLLRAVESGEVLPVGAERVERTDARIIAASSTSLEDAVRAGSFRRDLYYRLRVLTLRLPPLRDCREDIPLLAGRLLEAVCCRLSVPPHRLSPEAMAAFVAAAWPGNVRQLIHELERAVVTSEGLEIELAHLSPELQALGNDLGQRPAAGRSACRSIESRVGRSLVAGRRVTLARLAAGGGRRRRRCPPEEAGRPLRRGRAVITSRARPRSAGTG